MLWYAIDTPGQQRTETRLDAGSSDSRDPELVPLGGTERAALIWIQGASGEEQDTKLMARGYRSGAWSESVVLIEDAHISEFAAVRVDGERLAIVYEQASGDGPDLFLVTYDVTASSLSAPIQLTSDPATESQLDVSTQAGYVMLAYVQREIVTTQKTMTYSGPDAEDPSHVYDSETIDVTIERPGAPSLFLLRVPIDPSP